MGHSNVKWFRGLNVEEFRVMLECFEHWNVEQFDALKCTVVTALEC